MTSRVQVEAQPPIAVVRLDGPKRHNVLDRDGWLDLAEKLGTLSDRNDVSCVAVRGRGGRAFSAGSDIAAHPTIAIIEGICVGGGLEIAACCDLRVCGESSRFGAPINRLGLTMSHEEIQPLLQLLGPAPVLEILLTGELMDAERALAVGLVNRIWPDAEVVENGHDLIARVAAGAPLVNRWHKKFVHRLLHGTPLTREEREEVHEAFETVDYREGRSAFLEKREPHFTGE